MKKRQKGILLLITGIIILLSYLFSLLKMDELLINSLLIIVTLILCLPIYQKAINALLYRIIGIEALVSVAVSGAMIIQEFKEAAVVTFLFTLGAYLEGKTLEKTRKSLKALIDLTPSKAIVLRDGIETEILYTEVLVNETVIVKPGGKVPVDGLIIKGNATLNQAAITGESVPIEKVVNDNVFSGTIVESGYLEIQALHVGSDTTFARIIELVEEAIDKKAQSQKFIEKFSKYYTPAIMLLSLVMYFFTSDIKLALTLLVISCPGALVISIPVSIVAGIGNAARQGILIKGGDALEKAARIKVVAFDKTGTLTKGEPIVTDIITYDISVIDLLEIASAIESASEHHLAKAIINESRRRRLSITKADEFVVYPGAGVTGIIKDKEYFLGNRKLMSDNGIKLAKMENDLVSLEKDGKTTVIIADRNNVIGIIAISDEVKPSAYTIADELRSHGIKKVIMLTGDTKLIGENVGKRLKINEVYSETLPQHKSAIINDIKKKDKVVMIGDGINDAIALASADLSVSMGKMGTDVAIETADIVLLSDDLKKLNTLFTLSRATRLNMLQNLFFALLVVFFLIAGVILGEVVMSFGMLIHELSVIIVILNAIRLNRFKRGV